MRAFGRDLVRIDEPVAVPDKVEDGSQGARDVEVVVHGGAEPLFARTGQFRQVSSVATDLPEPAAEVLYAFKRLLCGVQRLESEIAWLAGELIAQIAVPEDLLAALDYDYIQLKYTTDADESADKVDAFVYYK